ncbi:regulatory protein [Paenibacillus beijingensis]|uniref:Regulatory protein n=1 Tax=Paenibacillus beijingensis TaxID=1126833 RepID=A0A0D5NRE1_9BACL|nr:regulatory protein [Paenibacillus beijingensis]
MIEETAAALNSGIATFFSEENMERLQGVMYAKSARAGSYLFWEGDAADKLYYVKKGQVRITKSADNGRTLTLYLHLQGDLFGQVDPFRDSVHGFNAEVTEDSEIGIIQQKDLEVLLWQHGDLAIEFMKFMGLMHRRTQTKFRDLMMFGKPGALCSLLIRLGNTYGQPGDNGIIIGMKMTNTEMADMIGTTRENVNRMLSDMKKEDVISMEEGHIVIRNLNYLRDICRCESCPKEICRM